MYKAKSEVVADKTFVAIAHGYFLNTLACLFTNNLGNVSQQFFIPENNSITILEYADVKQDKKEFVDCKLTAYNLKLHTFN